LIVWYPCIFQFTNIENALFLHQNISKMPLYHMKALSFEDFLLRQSFPSDLVFIDYQIT